MLKANRYQELFNRSLEHPNEFWLEQAQSVAWYRHPERAISDNGEERGKWFTGGKLNTCHLALDHHVSRGRAHQPALIYDSPVTGTQQSFSYGELLDEVSRFAGGLRELGVERGDTIIIYMPMIPQTIVAMLACARLGAVHSVVFGGFAARELAIRIDDAKPKLLVTATCGKEAARVIDYLAIVDEAMERAAFPPRNCIVYQRPFHHSHLRDGRDIDWDQLVTNATPADCVELDASDPLYILYTSGTTGKPKGIVRDHGGHAVALQFSMDAIYGANPGEVFWAASDVGWVVGHSYIVYGPLFQGCTTVLYEGKPVRTPDAGAFWRVVEEHDVRVMFTAPTGIRAIKREDPQGQLLKNYDTSDLRYLFLAGERCDVATLHWIQQLLDKPVIDHWWQTESGWPMVANMAATELLPVKPGSVSRAVPGYDIRILDPSGRELGPNREGAVAVKLPLPPGCLSGLWNNPQRFQSSYFQRFPGYYQSGDGGYIDEDGYVYVTGRMDDVINVAGHRLSTATMEEVVSQHPAVAECAVIGVDDELKGEVPMAFVTLKAGQDIDESQLEEALVRSVREHVGPIALLKQVVIVAQLPKTRSGKILRRTMRSLVDEEEFQIPSTIEDKSVLDMLANTLCHKVATDAP